MSRNAGFTTMENLVAISIALVVGLAMVGGLVSYRKLSQNVILMSSTDKEVNDIGENIRANMESFQINYNFSAADKEKYLALSSLPMAWDVGISMPTEQCSDCAGRYGYIIQPFEEFRGLYVVTLRMTHKNWEEPFREFQFVVSAK